MTAASPMVEHRYAELGEVMLHYVTAGQGPPVVLLHGGGPGASGMSNFQHNLPVFAERFRTLVVDQPGYGKSDKPQVRGNYFTFAPGALNDLPEVFRTPMILFYFEEFSYRDIAEQMDLPLGTVMSRLARAKAYLRGRLLQPETPLTADGHRRATDGL